MGERQAYVLILRERDCIGAPDYRPATPEQRAAKRGLHGYAFGGTVEVYEPQWIPAGKGDRG